MKFKSNFSSTLLKYITMSVSFITTCFLGGQTTYAVTALDNASDDGRPTYHSGQSDFPGSVSPLVHAAPKSLSSQKLNSSSYPEEAELYCGTQQCIFGLSRGLVVGGNLAGMLYAPLRQYFDPNWVSGSLSIMDIFGGFQILRDVNSKNYMNAQIGYRRVSFDDGTNAIVTQGLTTAVNYSQLITPIYLQSVEFSAFFITGDSSLNNISALNINSSAHGKLNNTAGYFYRILQSYPTYQLFLPADLELINWSTSQIGLPMPIHGYLEVNPFYIQNSLSFSGNNLSLRKSEQNFGLRVAGISSYESVAEKTKSGRYALKGEFGLDISTSSFTTTSSGNADLDLPRRSFISPYVELAGSWQF